MRKHTIPLTARMSKSTPRVCCKNTNGCAITEKMQSEHVVQRGLCRSPAVIFFIAGNSMSSAASKVSARDIANAHAIAMGAAKF